VVGAATPDEVPEEIRSFDLGLCFIRPHFSKLASCPTKVGEYLAAGVPVVANSGIGDLDDLLSHENVGIVLDDLMRATMVASMPLLRERLSRKDLTAACRRVAEAHFSIGHGIAAYDGLYRKILERIE
jgi:glycosyltransferase involved in cell wall biosynthesis